MSVSDLLLPFAHGQLWRFTSNKDFLCQTVVHPNLDTGVQGGTFVSSNLYGIYILYYTNPLAGSGREGGLELYL